jgi:hypothetical protein
MAGALISRQFGRQLPVQRSTGGDRCYKALESDMAHRQVEASAVDILIRFFLLWFVLLNQPVGKGGPGNERPTGRVFREGMVGVDL